jgi:hypothetical protein
MKAKWVSTTAAAVLLLAGIVKADYITVRMDNYGDDEATVDLTVNDDDPDNLSILVDASAQPADIRGMFIDFNNFPTHLTRSDLSLSAVNKKKSAPVTSFSTILIDEGGVPIKGKRVKSWNLAGRITPPFQAGLEIGTNGAGKDDIDKATVYIKNQGLSITDIGRIGVRLTSVGIDREGSSKLAAQVPEPGSLSLMLFGLLSLAGIRLRKRR